MKKDRELLEEEVRVCVQKMEGVEEAYSRDLLALLPNPYLQKPSLFTKLKPRRYRRYRKTNQSLYMYIYIEGEREP